MFAYPTPMILNPDKPLTLFSSNGKLKQCDNALKAADNSALSIGCAAVDGVVLASFKRVSNIVVKERFNKVYQICSTIGITYCGLQPDFNEQLSIAIDIAQEYYMIYKKYPNLDVFITDFSNQIQEKTQQGGLRPFGTLLFLAGAGSKPNESICYAMEPSGSYRRVDYAAGGVGGDKALDLIKRRREMLDDNIITCVNILKEACGKAVEWDDVSIGVYRTSESVFKVYDSTRIKEIFDSINK